MISQYIKKKGHIQRYRTYTQGKSVAWIDNTWEKCSLPYLRLSRSLMQAIYHSYSKDLDILKFFYKFLKILYKLRGYCYITITTK